MVEYNLPILLVLIDSTSTLGINIGAKNSTASITKPYHHSGAVKNNIPINIYLAAIPTRLRIAPIGDVKGHVAPNTLIKIKSQNQISDVIVSQS